MTLTQEQTTPPSPPPVRLSVSPASLGHRHDRHRVVHRQLWIGWTQEGNGGWLNGLIFT